MINTDTRLLDLNAKLGCEAFCVLLQIARFTNIAKQARPLNYTLSQLTGLSKRKITEATNLLSKEGLITKQQIFVTEALKAKYPKQFASKKTGAFWGNSYTITTSYLSIFVSLEGQKANIEEEIDVIQFDDIVTDDSVKSTHKSISNNISINKEKIKKEKVVKFNCFDYLENLNIEPALKESIRDWLEMRIAKKCATTQKAIDLNIKKVMGWYSDLTRQIETFNNSTMNGWQGVFPLKELTQNSKLPYNSFENNQFVTKPAEFTAKRTLDMSQYPDETLEDFEARCEAREAEGDVRVNRRYRQSAEEQSDSKQLQALIRTLGLIQEYIYP